MSGLWLAWGLGVGTGALFTYLLGLVFIRAVLRTEKESVTGLMAMYKPTPESKVEEPL